PGAAPAAGGVTVPPAGAGGGGAPPRAGAPASSHTAAEYPCQLGSPPGVPVKCSRRVCVPASVSIFSVVSSCHEMRSRPGTRMIPAAPYDLHALPAAVSLAGSQASATARAAALRGTLA